MEIKDGTIYVYYSFDVANEIKLEKLEKVLGQKPIESQLPHTRLAPSCVKYTQPPYYIKLGEKQKVIAGKKYNIFINAKIYDFGVISIRFSKKFSGSLEELAVISKYLAGNDELEKEARKYADKMKKELSDVMVRPVDSNEFEDYIVFYVKEFDRPVTPTELSTKYGMDITKILRSETEELSEMQVKDALKAQISYYPDEIVFLDWNTSFVYDHRDSILATLDVIEYANIELLELRAYDAVLDKEIDTAYNSVGSMASKPWYLLGLQPFSPTMKKLEEVRFDVTQVLEKVENALKLVGDPYLAKVYRSTAEILKLKEWKASVDGKLDIIENFYDTMVGRAQTSLLLWLELFMVLLFVADLAILLLAVKTL